MDRIKAYSESVENNQMFCRLYDEISKIEYLVNNMLRQNKYLVNKLLTNYLLGNNIVHPVSLNRSFLVGS